MKDGNVTNLLHRFLYRTGQSLNAAILQKEVASILFESRENQTSIRAAKAKTVCQRNVNLLLLRLVRNKVEFWADIWVGEVQSGWNHVL